LTPPEIIESLGGFDLDPCAPIVRPWDTARKHFTIQDDGLSQPWAGRVWLNPPYGRATGEWLARLAAHGDGVALIFARTETEMFFENVWHKADGVFFFDKRLVFYHVTGEPADNNGGAPSCLVAYGADNALVLSTLPNGFFVRLNAVS
jgi:hypothetical protein